MKRAMAIVLACMVLSSSAFAEDTIHTFWDIPFGISLEDAAEKVKEKAEAILVPFTSEEGKLWFYYTPEEYPLMVNGHPFEFRASSIYGFKDESQNNDSFQSMSFSYKSAGAKTKIDMKIDEFQKCAEDLYQMVCAKCGQPDTVSFMHAKAGREETYTFDIPLNKNGNPDVARILSVGEKDFKIEIVWGNVSMGISGRIYDDKEDSLYSIYDEPYISLYIGLSVIAKAYYVDPYYEYKGNYFEYLDSLKIGVTSF